MLFVVISVGVGMSRTGVSETPRWSIVARGIRFWGGVEERQSARRFGRANRL